MGPASRGDPGSGGSRGVDVPQTCGRKARPSPLNKWAVTQRLSRLEEATTRGNAYMPRPDSAQGVRSLFGFGSLQRLPYFWRLASSQAQLPPREKCPLLPISPSTHPTHPRPQHQGHQRPQPENAALLGSMSLASACSGREMVWVVESGAVLLGHDQELAWPRPGFFHRMGSTRRCGVWTGRRGRRCRALVTPSDFPGERMCWSHCSASEFLRRGRSAGVAPLGKVTRVDVSTADTHPLLMPASGRLLQLDSHQL